MVTGYQFMYFSTIMILSSVVYLVTFAEPPLYYRQNVCQNAMADDLSLFLFIVGFLLFVLFHDMESDYFHLSLK